MSVLQISVFVESRPGHLKRILDLFEQNNVNVRGYSCSDTGDYGIARFVVDDPERATSALKDAGAAVTQREILCLKLNDDPGELARVFGVLSELNMNVKYSYSLISTYIAVGIDDVSTAEGALKNQPVEFVSQQDLR